MLELLKIGGKMIRELQKELVILEEIKEDLPEHLINELREPLAAYIDSVNEYVDAFEQQIAYYIRRQLDQGKV